MAKTKKPKVNVSQAIRDILADDPSAKPADIVELLKTRHKQTVSAHTFQRSSRTLASRKAVQSLLTLNR